MKDDETLKDYIILNSSNKKSRAYRHINHLSDFKVQVTSLTQYLLNNNDEIKCQVLKVHDNNNVFVTRKYTLMH